MLDAMQNTILNKPDSIVDRRPHSPSSDVSKLENKFEDMFNKQRVKARQEAETSTFQKLDDKSPLAKALQNKTDKTKEDKNITQAKDEALAKNLASSSKSEGANTSKPQATKTAPFDFKDETNEDSKIGLQEKIAKSSKENKPKESNPLVEALNAPLMANAGNMATESNTNAKMQNPLPRTMPTPAQMKAAMNETLNEAAPEAKAPKTLADVEKLAKAQGLNPAKIALETESESKPPKPKTIPASAKESISYEYENNVDRIAIVQRGIKKPKNITSKINDEYPVKKADEDSSSGGNTLASLLKDTPQQGQKA